MSKLLKSLNKKMDKLYRIIEMRMRFDGIVYGHNKIVDLRKDN